MMKSEPSRRDCANAIRVLAMDAVQRANSGHPGMPMGMADIAQVLWHDFLKYNPKNPAWSNRDRFILSNGHGAMLQYALLHLTGFDVSLEDLKQFRQLHSKTPGHPEYGETPGVETTTGPLGQGLANAVGMAIAEQMLATHFNREYFPIVDHFTYVFVGDGCLMEGISHEACSLAGTLQLGKLIVIYDDNGISIDGEVQGWFTDDTPKRFAAYHWHVIPNVDGHNPRAIHAAILEARAVEDRPSIICCKTQIGHGAPNLAGTAASHGAPLGDVEVNGVRENFSWFHPPFFIPDEIYAAWDARERGQLLEGEWNRLFAAYETKYPELASEYLRRQQGHLPDGWKAMTEALVEQCQKQGQDIATRKSSLQCLNTLVEKLPELIGGSADLSESNCTEWKNAIDFSSAHPEGRYLKYGVREFAMSAIMNGIAQHKGLIPYGGTFLTFCDYARNAVRLAALMQSRVIFVYTHDSIGLGEDGPTHQPIEHIAMLRMTPNLRVWRPCDDVETTVAWQQSIEHHGPSCILLTRQNVPHQHREPTQLKQIAKGAYILLETKEKLEVILLATGSEVALAISAAKILQAQHVGARVVSIPCCEVFKVQTKDYRDMVLPSSINKKIAIEAGVPDYWWQFVGSEGMVMGLSRFGASAPAKAVYSAFGLTTEKVVEKAQSMLERVLQ